MTYTIGSVCSGFGGADLAVEAVLGPVRHLWHAEYDPEADRSHPLYKPNNVGRNDPLWKGRILAAHWPDIPNLGDMARINWADVEPPDVLTGGFPCKDISCAGGQAGMGFGTRSGVWSYMAEAIATLRPRLVLIENVRALLSTHAQRNLGGTNTASDLESAASMLGDGADRPVLRALGAVLGDLADLGFDAQWATVPASAVGACHRRERVFILAWPADSESLGHWHTRAEGFAGIPSAAVAGGVGTDGLSLLPTPASRLGTKWGTRSAVLAASRLESGRRNLEDAVALLPTPTAAEGTGAGHSGHSGGLNLRTAVALLSTPAASDRHGSGRYGAAAARPGPTLRTVVTQPDRWGRYTAAIRRWERVTGRIAPEPTEVGTKGQARLSPRFVEWMQGLPDGWVTDHVGRSQALHALGDGVVWQQGAYALRLLLASAVRQVAA